MTAGKAGMARRNFYLLTLLPDLHAFGSEPPLGKQPLLSLVAESEGPTEIVETLLLSDDLIQREAVLKGEIEPDKADTAVLSLSGVENDGSLPVFLFPETEAQQEIPEKTSATDRIWERFFHHATRVARSENSRFLAAWVGYEVGLRNALVTARAEALDLDPAQYRVAPELGDPEISYDEALDAWSAGSNPLVALEGLDRARWNRLSEQEPWYSFSDDEVASYTAKLLLLHRWRRISEKTPSATSAR